jgi:Sec-independent protein secretion pathway component TatC
VDNKSNGNSTIPYTTGPRATGRLPTAASLVGLVAAAAALPALARRDPSVRLERARVHLVAVPAAFLVGAVVGARAVVPLAAALDVAPPGPGVGVAALGEFALGLVAASGAALALPSAVLGAFRAGLVPRYTSTGGRGLAALAVLAFASLYSPADLPSFALVALPPFGGLAAGLALLEFRG